MTSADIKQICDTVLVLGMIVAIVAINWMWTRR